MTSRSETLGSENLASRSSRDHRELLKQLDDLIRDLDQLDPPFLSWQAAISELERFIDSLEQHESYEFQRINSLFKQGAQSSSRS